jgi:colicin import membrane protein
MGFARRTLRFGSGLIFGAAIGTAISVLLAPQSGEELKAELADRTEEAKRAGEEAELLETERLKRLFRVAVHDESAFTGKFDDRKREKSPADEAAERLKKEQKEAANARRDERRAAEAVAKAQEQARKAEEDARKARAKSQKEEADVARAHREAVDKSAQS